MAYKLYLTVELPEEYATKEAAMDAAVAGLQAVVESFYHGTEPGDGIFVDHLPARPIEMRVFAEGKVTSGEQHDFIVDIHDGAI